MTEIKDWPTKVYNADYFVPIQNASRETGKIRLGDIPGTSAPPPSGGGLSPWQTITADYTADYGDRLYINASLAPIIVTLPQPPVSGQPDIWIQRLDSTSNLVLIRVGPYNLNDFSGSDGVFAPSVPQLVEVLNYPNANIGWLGQHNLLTLQPSPFN